MLKRLITISAMIAFLAIEVWFLAPPAHGEEMRGSVQSPSVSPPVVIKGMIFDSTTSQPIGSPLYLRLSKVDENGIIGEVVEETNYSTGEGVMTGGSFYFSLDSKTFVPGNYYIESFPYVSDPQSYLGGHITFPVDWPGTYVSFFVEPTFVRISIDFNALSDFIPSEGGELTYGFWIEGDDQDIDILVRVGDLGETGYPASKEVSHRKLYQVCNEYVAGSVQVSGKLPNGKFQCLHVYVTEPDNFERVLAWTQFCVPKLSVSATETPVPVDEPKG